MHILRDNKISMHCILASLYFVLLPLTISVNSSGTSFLKLLAIPISIYFFITLFFYRKEFQINIVHIVLVVYTACTLFTVFVNPSAYNFEYIKGYFLNAGLFVCLSVVEYNEKELKILENVQIALLVFISLITFYNNSTLYDRVTLSIFGQASDPNYFVGFFIFPLSVTMKKIYESKHRIIYIAVALAGLYAIFLSGSRGGLLAVITTVVAFAFIYPPKAVDKITILGGMILVGIVLWVVVRPTLSDTVIERMSLDAVIETGGTHRVDIWKAMLTKIKDSKWEILFGRGLGTLHPIEIGGKVVFAGAHNHIIQVLYDQGIIGILTYLLLVVCSFARCVKKRKCVAVAIVGMMALSVSLSFNPSIKAFWNLIPYAAFAFPINNTENKTEV